MALVSLNLQPSDKQLRDFGLIALCMCGVIGLLLFWLDKIQLTGLIVFCLIGIVIFSLSRISTALIKPVYQGMMIVTFPIGWVVSHVMMALFYYGIVTLIAIVFKIIGRDPLCRKYQPEAESYWIPYQKSRSPKHYFHQF